MQSVTALPLSSGINSLGENGAQAYVQLSTSPPTHARYPRTLVRCLGGVQLATGLYCVAFNIVSLVFVRNANLNNGLAYVGHGFWCGTLFVVTGSIGIATGHRTTRRKIVAYNIMSIISTVFSAALLVCGVIGAVRTSFNANNCYGNSSNFCFTVQVITTMESLLAVFALIAAILFILSAIVCCKHGGCGNRCSNQNTDHSSQLVNVVPSITPLQEGLRQDPTSTEAEMSSAQVTWNPLQWTHAVPPLVPSAPSLDSYHKSTRSTRPSAAALYPQLYDDPVYDNYAI